MSQSESGMMNGHAGGAWALSRAALVRHLTSRWLVWLLFGLTCAFAVLDLLFLALGWSVSASPSWGFRGSGALFALAFGSVGQLLARRRPENRIGWLFLIAGLSAGIYGFGIEYSTYALLVRAGALPLGSIAAWVASWLWIVMASSLLYVLLLFPTGRLPSQRWWPVEWIVTGVIASMLLGYMLRPGPLSTTPYVSNPVMFAGSDRAAALLIPMGSVGVVISSILAGSSMLLRLRRATGVERQQLKWFAYATGLVCVIILIDGVAVAMGLPSGQAPKPFQFLTIAVMIAIPFSVGIAIMRYRLYEIDRIINRTLVYVALSAGVVVIYVLTVGALGVLFQASGNLVVSLIATGVVALLFQPLRERLQRGVNRLLYGERDEPYALIARLGQHLETTTATGDILATLVRTIAQALKLPYIAIETSQGGAVKIAAAFGQPPLRAQRLPLAYQAETVGHLLVAPRSPNESLSSADLNLLRMIAQQASMAVHAVQLTEDLQRSRERLVVAREEERRRIRRDLHDGLGPALASLAMQADGAREWAHSDPDKTEGTLAEIASNAQTALQDIRRLVYELRPPALDELGLIGALRQQVANFPNGLHINFDAPESLPPLSAAVEVAAYRIAQEALNNVARHSQARNGILRIVVQDELRLELSDDGAGLPPDVRAGVGLISMRERAAELGGSCIVESAPGKGTRVLARLPLAHQHVGLKEDG